MCMKELPVIQANRTDETWTRDLARHSATAEALSAEWMMPTAEQKWYRKDIRHTQKKLLLKSVTFNCIYQDKFRY